MVKFHFSQIEESCNNNNIIIIIIIKFKNPPIFPPINYPPNLNLQILPFYHFTILPLMSFLLDSQHLVVVEP